MDKILKNVVNKTIERECERAEENFQDLLKKNPEIAARFGKNEVEYEDILKKIKEALPEEYKDLADRLDSVAAAINADEHDILYKEGVISGIKNLNYLSEIPDIEFI